MKRLPVLLAVSALLLLAPAPPVSATYPGANGRIAFTRAGDIYTVTAAGTGLRRLTTYGGGVRTPRWSPDGTQIAYVHRGSIYTMNADGSDQVRRFPGRAPSWSPDGLRLAYATTQVTTGSDGRPCRYNALVTQALTAENPREIEGFDSLRCIDDRFQRWESFGPTTAWAGTRVYYSAIDYSNPVDFGTEAQIDGIAYAQPDGADWDGGVLVANGDYGDGEGTADTTPPTVDSAPDRPDIVYTIPDLDDRRPPSPGAHLVPTVRGTDGSDYVQQISADGNVTFPAYSPDGRFVLYTHHPPGRGFSVRIVTLPGSPTTEATTLIHRAQQPSWQPVG